MKRLLSLALLVTLGAACQGNAVLVSPPSFDRPSDLAFICMDTVTLQVLPLSRCEFAEGGTDDVIALTALVTQTAAGEVAAVDLRAGRGVLDADPRVPGFTFVRVGELPSGIVVPAEDPSLTYVANLGSKTIQSVATLHFHPDAEPPPEDLAREVVVGVPQGGPSDLLLSPTGDALFAPIPSAGVVVRIPLGLDGTPQAPEELPALEVTVPPAVAATGPDPYQRVCGRGVILQDPAVVAPRDVGDTTGVAPRPVRLRLDTDVDPPVLLVADESLPLVHRYSLAEGGIVALPPLNTGVPVRDIALTPLVPALVDSDVATEAARYLYAIDDEDQSVLVVDYLEGSPTFGAVLPVNVGDGAADRISFPASARGIELMMPDYPDGTVCEHGSEEAVVAAPALLRGVFLAVTLADGTVRIVDVHDLDAACRGGITLDCCDNPLPVPAPDPPVMTNPCARPNANDVQVFVRRHRPRIAVTLSRSFAIGGTPTLSFEGSPGTLGLDGIPTVAGPQLEPVGYFADGGLPDGPEPEPGCPPEMLEVFPGEEGDALVCVLTDPWSTRPELWQATWEGAIPGANGGRARFRVTDDPLDPLDDDLDVVISDSDVSPCARGVLGSLDVADLGPDEPEAGYVGDQLIITSDVPPSREEDERCAAFLTTDQEPIRDPEIGFRIRSASSGGFDLGEATGASLDTVQHCFPELFSYQVHSRLSYVVTGSTTGFLHRVVDGARSCEVDTSQVHVLEDRNTHRQSRAFGGSTFTNPFVAFRISEKTTDSETPLPTNVDAQLRFVITDVPAPLGANVGLLPETVFYNPVDNALYVIDVSGEALIRFEMDPFRREATYE